jgi:simple sugar transport system ATP-binding protein
MKLETKKISIEFPGVKALEDINFAVSTGEIHALVGANGAGKSTLMKVLAGANPTYTGEVLLDNKKVELRTPVDAKRLGIQIVYQEVDVALYPTLSVAENIVQNDMIMGQSGYVVNWGKVYKQGRDALGKLHISRKQIDEHELVQNLSLAEKQMVLIAKAIRSKCNFLIFDEPTSSLSNTEAEELFRVVRHLHKTENIAIIFISHRLNEIFEICENYTVMRNGKIVGNAPLTAQTKISEIVEKMLSRKFEEVFPKEKCKITEKLFEVEHLSGAEGKVKDVSLYVRSGEIVGIAGLVGAGKSEFCKTIFGVYKKTGGKMLMQNRELKINKPSEAVKHRLALVPEERRKEGVLIHENVSLNLSIACLSKFCTASFINSKLIDKNAEKYIKTLGIDTPSVKQMVRNLSGGNQQKVAVGKWLEVDSDIYIFDEPTKGVDVGAKQDIFRLINEIAKRGKGVIFASCENSELLALTDRIYVMYNGTVVAELETAKTKEDEIMKYSVGVGFIKTKKYKNEEYFCYEQS